ncbi:hypothetical protein E8E11_000625 [Didymella keratinophila]|nr:hypothetical protein E8E11_000625 [Didymella keratinophila]
MSFSRPTSLSGEVFTSFTLLALCTLALIYHFYSSTTTIYRDIQYLGLPFSPRPSSSSIPKILWYKLGPLGLNNDTQHWTDSCIAANPDYDVQFLTNEDAEDFVYTAFSNRPDILEAYFGLTVPILRADMLRYMLLYDQGGIWSDLDVSCEDTPIDEWIPVQFRGKAGLVVGWEFDVGWDPGIVRQFASWMIMARPGSPHMLTVIEGIVNTLHEIMKKEHVSIGNVTLNMTGDVADFSGPRRLTKGVFKSLEYMLDRTVSPDEAKEILQPVLLERGRIGTIVTAIGDTPLCWNLEER